MNPLEELCYLCSQCKKSYPHNEHGKRFAEACCKCIREGCPFSSAYTGLGNICTVCHAQDNLKATRDTLEHAKRNMNDAMLRMERLKPGYVESTQADLPGVKSKP